MDEVLVNCLFKLAQEKVWLGEHPTMTIAVDLGRKATKQTKNKTFMSLVIVVYILRENILAIIYNGVSHG